MHATTTERAMPDHSDVPVFPPLVPASGVLLGILLGQLVPLAPSLSPRTLLLARELGVAVFCIGIAGFPWMIITMKRARTPIHNARTPTRLVDSGPFRFTRNPMYLFGGTWYAGLAMMLHQPWSLALLPLVHLVIDRVVVRREEAYLERKFGDAYRAYTARVPRWL